MKIAVIGGGWAGLSAATRAVQLGHDVSLFESATVLGGRARSVVAPSLGTVIDNGQHILLGAYTATLALMRDLGLDPASRFTRMPLNIRSADSTLRMQAVSGMPAPLHILAGLLGAQGLSWTEKWASIRLIHGLRRNHWRTAPNLTVRQWLDANHQPARLQQLIWIPLCIATLNTPAQGACAQLFATVLRDSLGSADRHACDMLIPKVPLSALWPETLDELARSGAVGHDSGAKLEIHRSTTVRRLHYAECGAGPERESKDSRRSTCQLLLDERAEAYDAVVVCSNTPSAARLLATLPKSPRGQTFIDGLKAFSHAPIATLTIELERGWKMPWPMLLLHEDRRRGHYGQWLFQGNDHASRMLHMVVSDADALSQQDRHSSVTAMLEQVEEQLRAYGVPPVSRHALIIEKRATFLAVPGMKRPGHRTPWVGVWVAGDWTDTDYPAVLEGAVRSGRDAAEAVHAHQDRLKHMTGC